MAAFAAVTLSVTVTSAFALPDCDSWDSKGYSTCAGPNSTKDIDCPNPTACNPAPPSCMIGGQRPPFNVYCGGGPFTSSQTNTSTSTDTSTQGCSCFHTAACAAGWAMTCPAATGAQCIDSDVCSPAVCAQSGSACSVTTDCCPGQGLTCQDGTCLPGGPVVQTPSQTTTQTATQMAASSVTQSSTATQTNVTHSTETQTSAANEAETRTNVNVSEATATGENLNQNEAQNEAARALGQGALDAATVGAFACTEGANVSLTDPSAGGALLSSCVHTFATAKKMKQLEAKTLGNADGARRPAPLAVCGTTAQSASAQPIADDFEQNYGMPASDFMNELAEGHGSPDVLADLLSKKLPKKQVYRELGQAANLPEGAAKEAVKGSRAGAIPTGDCRYQLGDAVAGGSVGHSGVRFGARGNGLRNQLHDRLAESARVSRDKDGDKARTRAADDANQARGLANLSPLPNMFGSDAQGEAGELTIFDVVHRKYQEKARYLDPASIRLKR